MLSYAAHICVKVGQSKEPSKDATASVQIPVQAAVRVCGDFLRFKRTRFTEWSLTLEKALFIFLSSLPSFVQVSFKSHAEKRRRSESAYREEAEM